MRQLPIEDKQRKHAVKMPGRMKRCEWTTTLKVSEKDNAGADRDTDLEARNVATSWDVLAAIDVWNRYWSNAETYGISSSRIFAIIVNWAYDISQPQ